MALVLVTGSNRGIGLELVRQCAARGDHVIACCRDPAGATELAALAQASAGAIDVRALDVADADSVADLRIALGTRPIDVLINNAGVLGPDNARLQINLDAFAETLAVNTLGPLRMARAFSLNLHDAGADGTPGKIVTITSQMGSMTYGSADRMAYRASKAAVNKVMQCLAADLRQMGVAVLLLHPGWVRTDMGGPGADISAQESAAGILARIDALTLAGTGAFLDHAGRRMPW